MLNWSGVFPVHVWVSSSWGLTYLFRAIPIGCLLSWSDAITFTFESCPLEPQSDLWPLSGGTGLGLVPCLRAPQWSELASC